MSLLGSLEDLGLADVLQILSLSRKSGVLVLRGGDGEGRIVFREGLVHAAAVKGAPDLDALRRGTGLGADATAGELEALRRDHVERVIARLFEWRTGEFHFEVQEELAAQDRPLALTVGLSPQYLTMEATRRGDELRAEAGSAEPVLVFSGEEEAPPAGPGPAHELVVAAAVARVEALEAVEPAPEARSDPAAARAVCSQAVVVDGDLAGLEWLKASLAGSFARVHLFQTAEGAIPRIRQYLMRGEVPAVLLSPRAPMDPLSGIDRAADLLRRLRALSPRMPLLLVAEEGAPPPAEARLADAVLWRPGATALLGRAGEPARAAAARALRDRVAPYARR